MDLKCEREGLALVLLGKPNPAIFHPLWFLKEQLVSESAAKKADIEIVQQELSRFEFGAEYEGIGITVEHERFVVDTTNMGLALVARDLAAGAFSVLKHTPLTAAGINRYHHFVVPTDQDWHKAGHKLAPKDIWCKYLNSPGLESMTVSGTRVDAPGRLVQISVEPSRKVEHGIFVSVNEHFRQEEGETDAGAVVEFLQKNVEDSLRWGREAAEDLVLKILSGVDDEGTEENGR